MKPFYCLFPLFVITLILTAGCAQNSNISEPVVEVSVGALPENATIAGIYEEAITLTDGNYEGEPFMPDSPIRPTVVLVSDLVLKGNLDGDDALEIAFFVEENSGGTGHFLYVCVLDDGESGVKKEAVKLVGDRVDVREARIDDGKIVLELVQGGPGDAACCPSQLAQRTWELEEGGLNELEPVIQGTLSLAMLEGTTWKLRQYGINGPIIEEAEITITFAEGKISGSSGCNQYQATITAGNNPADIKIGPVAGTKRLCPEPQMQAENKYQAALGSASTFSFFAGSLTLSYNDNGRYGIMLFDKAL